MEVSRDSPPQPPDSGPARLPSPSRLFLLWKPSEPLRVPWPLLWETSYLCFPGVPMEKLEVGERFRTAWPQWSPKTPQSQSRVSASTRPEPQGRWRLKSLPLHREHLQTMRHQYTPTRTVKTKKMGNSRCQRTTRADDLSRNCLQPLLKENRCQPLTQ